MAGMFVEAEAGEKEFRLNCLRNTAFSGRLNKLTIRAHVGRDTTASRHSSRDRRPTPTSAEFIYQTRSWSTLSQHEPIEAVDEVPGDLFHPGFLTHSHIPLPAPTA